MTLTCRAALLATALLASGLAACATAPGGPVLSGDMPPPPAATAAVDYVRDVHSYARPEVARVTHVDLDLAADFQRNVLSGTATLDVSAEPGAQEIILDVRDLDISRVRDAATGSDLRFTVGEEQAFIGRPLTIQLPNGAAGGTGKISIDYATRPNAAALQWLTPAQTAGGELPYLFSQGQAILTRTWIPTQDSPGIRQTYTARITAPAELTAVMSAEMLTPQGEAVSGDASRKAWRFRMTNPIPPYLIAIGVGDLEFASLGPRTGVWTEPSELAAARAEFPEVEAMVEAAEGLYGPYLWGRYDLLVLPPSFPFGGMENPRLTFATPTIIAGDRSLVSLVAHELAHSWSGNLVTNATWADFWLNEGFTSYFENRIMEAVYDRDRAVQEQVLAWDGLQAELAELPAADQRLHLDLAGRDPDEGMSTIAYDKGAALLRTIERIVGRERFDAWMRGYFERNAFRPMTTERFLEDIRTHLIAGDTRLEQQLMLDQWIYQPGMPSNFQPPVSDAFANVDQAALAFASGGPASAIPWSGWTTQQRQRFLGWRPEGQADNSGWLSQGQLADLDGTLGLSDAGNSEVEYAWFQVAVAHRYEPAVPAIEAFLKNQGRRKFVLPLFQSLWAQGDWGRPIATRVYAEARPGYHSVTANSVDEVVGWTGR
ncbi:M1 family metallopeptidase [Brevundimonas lutea]|uniref:M1 family metallopeptidase n=1 Tax=Brevundimonas lutea TaxID=2293980 RepID=UPI000F02570A|nr:M1 family metallopeptidase [Brevundimonas lutea]